MPGDPYYQSKAWRTLSDAVLRRDKRVCWVKGCKDRAVIADHIIGRKDGGPDTMANLRSLCKLHDNQGKERRDRSRGKFRIIGCTSDGWPLARQ
jgi:5-methylcytosine-specific restriction endonuclease McrA